MFVSPWLNRFRNRLSKRTARRPAPGGRRAERLEDRTLLTVVGTVTGSGGSLDPVTLTVFEDGGEDLRFQRNPTTGNVEVLADGSVVTSIPPVDAGDLEVLDVIGSDSDTSIDLTGLSSGEFTSLTSVTVNAADGNDTLTGSNDFAETLRGSDGDDVINGGGQGDSLDGGNGNDVIVGGAGDDVIDGDDGDDTIDGEAGADEIIGGDGADEISGGTGNDTIDSGEGSDLVDGGDDDDSIQGGTGTDTVMGGAGNDVLRGGGDDDSVLGGDGMDTLFGQGGQDTLLGEAGDDSLEGGSSNDSLLGGDGDDFAVGDLGNDTVAGGAGNDFLLGGGGDDDLDGEAGDDTLLGNSGNDTATGGTGSDLIRGGAGSDILQNSRGVAISVNDGSSLEGDQSALVDFAAAVNYAAINTPQTVASGDLNGDGIIDLVAANFNFAAEIAFLAGNGDGTFQPAVAIDPGGSHARSVILEVVDVDNDGDLDIIDMHMDGGTIGNQDISIQLNDGTGSFTPMEIVNVGEIDSISVADINGDGFVDILGSDSTFDEIIPLINNTDGTFSQPGGVSVTGVANNTFLRNVIGTGDIDGDGDTDLAVNVTGGVTLLTNDGTGSFTVGTTITTPGLRLELSDVDNDGDPDLVREDGTNVNVFLNNGSGVFGTAVAYPNNTSNAVSIRTVDLTGDGFVDIVTTHSPGSGGTQVNVLVNQGDGTFAAATLFTAGNTPRSTTAGDFDGDGDVDLAVSNFTSGNISVFLNQPVALNQITFTVSLSESSSDVVTVNYATTDGAAVAGVSYIPISGTLTFQPGETSQTLNVSIIGDTIAEPNEDFFLTLSSPVNATVDRSSGLGVIVDDDGGTGGPAPPPPSGSVGVEANVFSGSHGDDTIFGSPGNDTLDGLNGNDVIFGLDGDDVINGGNGNDSLEGGNGDDTLTGNSGTDTLNSGAGNDTYVWTGEPDGTDVLTEAPGFQTLQIDGDSATDNFTIDQTGSLLRVTEGTGSITINSTVTNVIVNGNDGDDNITLTGLDNSRALLLTVNGNAGNDTIDGSGTRLGNIIGFLNGDDGNDTIRGTQSDDTISGGNDDDSIVGDRGDDQIDAGDGTDFADGGEGNDVIDGGLGSDVLDGGNGDDVLMGDAGDDFLDGEAGDDTVDGGIGDDTLVGSFGNDLILGGSGADFVFAGAGNDRISGGTGDDFIRGHSGHDQIKGGDGDDTIRADQGDDTINGGDGNDSVESGDGVNIVNADDGNDTVIGGRQSDVFIGGDGNDLLIAGGGRDSVYGGEGDDTLRGNGSFDRFNSGEGSDQLPDLSSGEFDDLSLAISASVLQALAELDTF